MKHTLIGALLVLIPYVYMTRGDAHGCISPCTVRFDKTVQEDEFDIDWKHHQLKVWVKPYEREGGGSGEVSRVRLR